MKKTYKDKGYAELVLQFEEEIKIFGENIKRVRVRKGMTQQDLALESKVGLRTIQRIENGQMTVRLPLILALASALNVQITSFFKDIYT